MGNKYLNIKVFLGVQCGPLSVHRLHITSGPLHGNKVDGSGTEHHFHPTIHGSQSGNQMELIPYLQNFAEHFLAGNEFVPFDGLPLFHFYELLDAIHTGYGRKGPSSCRLPHFCAAFQNP